MKQLPIVVLLLLFAASCKKDANVTVAYNILYYKYEVKAAGGIRVFTDAGEVTDASIVNNFQASDSDYYNNFSYNVINNHEFLDTIVFKNQASAVVKYYGFENNYTVNSQDGKLVLTSLKVIPRVQGGETFTRSFSYYARQIKPAVSNEYIISSVGGYYQFSYSLIEKYVVTQAGNEKIAAPVVVYNEHSDGRTAWSGYFNGSLQNGFYKQIPAGDTVTLAEYQLIFNN